MDAMEHLRELFGSQRGLADALGIGESAVSMWRSNGIPAARKWQLVELCRRRGLPLNDDVLRAVPEAGEFPDPRKQSAASDDKDVSKDPIVTAEAAA